MAKLVYIGFPSPLLNAVCKSETGEDVPVTQVSRGVCQDISCIPEKKGKYKLQLEFEYDPSVLNNISNINISGTQDAAPVAPQDINSFNLNIPGLAMKPNEDGTICFTLEGEDGSTTEVNADIPGMSVVKKDDGSVSFSMPQDQPKATTTTTTTKKLPQNTNVRTTKTTTTTTTTIQPATTQTVVSGTMSIPRTQNINIKLPCPKHHQGNLKSACTGPDGASIPTQCTVIDDDFINLEYSPSSGNGTYSLNLLINDIVFPGCPIQMEVKGL